MKLTVYNPITKSSHTEDLPITLEQYNLWRSGTHIQKAMPNLSADQREFLISGTIPGDWDKIFTAEERDKEPEERKYFQRTTIRFKVGNVPIEFKIISNITSLGLSIDAAVINWSARTSEYTAKSFCDYVKSKDINTICMSEDEYQNLDEH